MEFEIDKFENHTLIKVMEEKLDMHIAPNLISHLMQVSDNGEKNIILDLSDCRYCDSSGLSAILTASRLCKNSGGTFVLSGLKDAVQRFFTISNLDTIINITENIKDAEALIKD